MSLASLIGQVLDDKYRIDRQLGRGGMGAVYLATHVGTERPVAVKVIAPQFMMNEEFVERFRREAKAAGRLRHPNVVNVTDFGFARVESERVAYLVMEYLDGCTLADILAEESRLPIDWVVDILEQACSAVDEAHQQGIIHRDLKPDNIWLEPNRRGGYTVKVLDFGLAKLGEPMAVELAEVTARDGSSPASTVELKPTSADTSSAPTTASIQPANATAFSEAMTRLQTGEEEQTRILTNEHVQSPSASDNLDNLDKPEAVAALQPGDGEQTRILDYEADRTRTTDNSSLGNQTIKNLRAFETASADGLTRVGSILGTPLYMSPEQCRSRPLDARSDIYSLGVIVYQMLAGQTPFTGELHEVIRQHVEAEPPPLREKRPEVPKRMAALVMLALTKNPSDRPESAAGFASALRASAEGIGALLRRALALYSEHFPQFFRVSLVMHIPMIAIAILQFVNELLRKQMVISPTASKVAGVIFGVLSFFVNFLAASVITGVTIRLVTQLFLAPLRPIQLRVAYRALKKRLKAFLITAVMAGLASLVGLILLVIPGIILFINYSLYGPVVMMENLKGRAALKRSKALVKRSRRTVVLTLLIQMAVPAIASTLTAIFIGSFLKAMKVGNAPELTGRITGIISLTLNILFIPFISTLTALLYLKTRQIGGETLKEALSQFEEEDTPRSKWQLRMRERLHMQSQPSRQ